MRVSRTLSVLIGALVLVGGANIAVYAANGGSFILGQSNQESSTSVLTNTGDGPALKLKAQGAPLAVSNSKKVKKLNADKVDGKNAAQLGTKAIVYESGSPGGISGFYAGFTDLAPGTYLATYSLRADFGSAGDYGLDCTLAGDVDRSIVTHGTSGGTRYATCSASGVVTTGAAPTFSVSGSAAWGISGSGQWTFLRLDKAVDRTPPDLGGVA